MSIYPNPAANNITLVLNTDETFKEATVELFDISGRKISSEKIAKKLVNIDVSPLVNGMYYITIENNGEKYMDKFIVTK